MPYVPRLYDEIFQSLLARVVTQSKLTDITPGSVLTHLLGTVAQELELAEFRLEAIRDSFSIDHASGSDLDLRVKDLPLAQIWRKASSKAQGEALRLTLTKLESTQDTLEIPVGLAYARSDTEDYVYIQANSVFVDMTISPSTGNPWNVGETFVYPDPDSNTQTGIRVIADSPGSLGNASKSSIDLVPEGAPPEILAVTNVLPVIGGSDGENDDALRGRARNYLGALSRITSAALLYIAKTFVSSDGTTFMHASVYEPVDVKGYTEILVDSGSTNVGSGDIPGQTLAENYTKASGKTIYKWPADASPPPYFIFEAPGTRDLDDSDVLIQGFWQGVGNDVFGSLIYRPLSDPAVRKMFGMTDPNEKFVLSICERGILYLNTDYPLNWSSVSQETQIDVWGSYINMVPYGTQVSIGSDDNPLRVYTGAVAEFQAIIEGDPSDPVASPGYRPAGTRVRVVLPTTQFVTGGVSIDITNALGYEPTELVPIVTDRVLFYAASIPPGAPLLVAELYSVVMAVEGIMNCTVVKPATDVSPSTARHSVRIDPDELEIL